MKIFPMAVSYTHLGVYKRQHQMWAAQYVKQTMPRNFLSSGGLGTMGFGYGAAIGAQMPDFPNMARKRLCSSSLKRTV